LQLTAICASCKPTLLCSDGCGAAAVHSMRGSILCTAAVANSLWGRVRLRLCARPPHRPRTLPTKSVHACTLRARVRACIAAGS
jgi:hypothetical protein